MTHSAVPAGRPALKIERLNAFYGKSQVTFDAELVVGRSEIVALLGRNGAGKTTTLMAIAGFVAVKGAAVWLWDRDIASLPAYRRVREGLSLTPSGSRAFRTLTVHENLRMSEKACTRSGPWSVEAVFGLFPKLRDLADSKGWQLSGGERQMLAIGRALLAQPAVLLLDEPSEGLAPIIVQGLGVILRQLREQGIAILLTEQNHGFALRIADRVLFMEKGQIVWEGSTAMARAPEVISRYLSV